MKRAIVIAGQIMVKDIQIGRSMTSSKNKLTQGTVSHHPCVRIFYHAGDVFRFLYLS